MPSSFDQLRRNAPLVTLLGWILDRVALDLPDALGLSILACDEDGVHVLAHRGDIESPVIKTQLQPGRGGPVPDAVTHQVPVISLDLLGDDRWPDLGEHILQNAPSALMAIAGQIGGAAAVPGSWSDDATVVLSSTLNRPASAATITTLIRYERLVYAALISATADIGHALTMVQSRGVIEQAKGAVMGRLGCDADRAFLILRDTSQRTNIKLRELALGLVELIGGAPAQQPTTPMASLAAADNARTTAQRLWAALDEVANPPTQTG